ncbi:MAG: Spy/CpxP family protein refolding chaperone [Xanthobacteraceae bacterium]|nr:Spy/CpxP family protein refolding chaperone [Xanthobacteraceae bacterium]
MTKHRRLVLMASAALAMTGSIAIAQTVGSGSGMMGSGFGMMGSDVMMGSRMCNRESGGFMQWRTEGLAETLKLNDAQRAKLEDFKAVSAKAGDTMRSACTGYIGATVPSRMEAMETRIGSMLTAITTIRPALDAFYASLTDDQKAQFDSRAGQHMRWREIR